MAAAATLTQMVLRVRDIADMPSTAAENWTTESSDNRFSTTLKIVRALNRALKQLYNKLLICKGEGRFTKLTEITLVNDQQHYDLPADFMEAESIVHFDGTTGYTPVNTYGHSDEAWLLSSESSYAISAAPFAVMLTSTQLSVLPIPGSVASGELIRLRYVPAFLDLVTPDDGFDGVNGWEDWACYRAAMELLGMEETDAAGAIMQSWAMLDQQIEDLAGDRSHSAPQVQDVEG